MASLIDLWIHNETHTSAVWRTCGPPCAMHHRPELCIYFKELHLWLCLFHSTSKYQTWVYGVPCMERGWYKRLDSSDGKLNIGFPLYSEWSNNNTFLYYNSLSCVYKIVWLFFSIVPSCEQLLDGWYNRGLFGGMSGECKPYVVSKRDAIITCRPRYCVSRDAASCMEEWERCHFCRASV